MKSTVNNKNTSKVNKIYYILESVNELGVLSSHAENLCEFVIFIHILEFNRTLMIISGC